MSDEVQTIEWSDIKPEDSLIAVFSGVGEAGEAGKEMVTVNYKGEVTLHDGFTFDEAAKIFWESIASNFPRCEVKGCECVCVVHAKQ